MERSHLRETKGFENDPHTLREASDPGVCSLCRVSCVWPRFREHAQGPCWARAVTDLINHPSPPSCHFVLFTRYPFSGRRLHRVLLKLQAWAGPFSGMVPRDDLFPQGPMNRGDRAGLEKWLQATLQGPIILPHAQNETVVHVQFKLTSEMHHSKF